MNGKREGEKIVGQIWSLFHRSGLHEKGNGKQIYLPIGMAQTKGKAFEILLLRYQ